MWWWPQRKGVGVVKGEGVKYLVMEDDLTLAGGLTMQYTDDVLQKWSLEACIILLTSVTQTNLKMVGKHLF